MKKKIIAATMAAAMCVSLAACGGSTASSSAAESTASSTTESTASSTADAASTGDEEVDLRMAWWGSQDRHDRTIKAIELLQNTGVVQDLRRSDDIDDAHDGQRAKPGCHHRQRLDPDPCAAAAPGRGPGAGLATGEWRAGRHRYWCLLAGFGRGTHPCCVRRTVAWQTPRRFPVRVTLPP